MRLFKVPLLPLSIKIGRLSSQGCQMVCFQTQNPNLGKFWRALDWNMFMYFIAVLNILWRFGIFYDHLVHFVFILYIFSGFGIMYQEKSGNPVSSSVPFAANQGDQIGRIIFAIRPIS
jgi:hypothetical protein